MQPSPRLHPRLRPRRHPRRPRARALERGTSYPVNGLLASACGFITQATTDPLGSVAIIYYSASADQVATIQAGSGPAFAFVPERGFYQRGYTDQDGTKRDILFATSNSTAVSATIIASSYADTTGAQSACKVAPGLSALIESKIPSGS